MTTILSEGGWVDGCYLSYSGQNILGFRVAKSVGSSRIEADTKFD
jgi:hypothetical protein